MDLNDDRLHPLTVAQPVCAYNSPLPNPLPQTTHFQYADHVQEQVRGREPPCPLQSDRRLRSRAPLHDRARASRLWVRTTLWLLFVFVIMQAVFQNEPFMQFGGLYFLVVTWASWMVTTGWKQIGYVRELFGSDYPRERLGRVTIFAGGCWVIYSMVSISIAMAIQLTGLDKMLPGAERAESQGVVLRVPEGSDKAGVEPLPVETRKAE